MKKAVIPNQCKAVNFRVKITRSLISFNWYHHNIGKVYRIMKEGAYHYYIKRKRGGIRAILKDDCKKLKP